MMTEDVATPKPRLTLLEALKDFGWFSALFAVLVSGPSVLSLAQAVFVDHKLVDALQWVVDGYNRIVGVIGAIFEPLLMPVVAWIGAHLHWDLRLQPHWKPLFVLGLVVAMSAARTEWRDRDYPAAIWWAVLGAFAALVGATIAGVVPLSGGWQAQGFVAAAPIVTFLLGMGIFSLVQDLLERNPTAHLTLIGILLLAVVLGAVTFGIAAGLSLLPGMQDGAGVLTTGLVILCTGLVILWSGLSSADSSVTRVSLTIMGGFAAAALIVAADACMKALGQT